LLLGVTDDCPNTAEVVQVSLRIVGRCQATMTVEIKAASTRTFWEGRGRIRARGRPVGEEEGNEEEEKKKKKEGREGSVR